MGNCIDTCEEHPADNPTQESKPVVQNCSNSNDNNVMRVKIVLTKEELEWLMQQLNTPQAAAGHRLEDVLWELQRSRDKAQQQPWKPSLETITEAPQMDR